VKHPGKIFSVIAESNEGQRPRNYYASSAQTSVRRSDPTPIFFCPLLKYLREGQNNLDENSLTNARIGSIIHKIGNSREIRIALEGESIPLAAAGEEVPGARMAPAKYRLVRE
jgi:hypothetical protein